MARERVGEEKDGVGRGGRGKLFRVEGWVRDHSCLPAQVSSQQQQLVHRRSMRVYKARRDE